MRKKPSRAKSVADRQVKLIESYQAVFRGAAGLAVLDDLMLRHHVLNSTRTAGVSPEEMQFREGERNVILRIMSMLKVNPSSLRERIETYAQENE